MSLEGFGIKQKVFFLAAFSCCSLVLVFWAASVALSQNLNQIKNLETQSLPLIETLMASRQLYVDMEQTFAEAALVGDLEWYSDAVDISDKNKMLLISMSVENDRYKKEVREIVEILDDYEVVANISLDATLGRPLTTAEEIAQSTRAGELGRSFQSHIDGIYKSEHETVGSQVEDIIQFNSNMRVVGLLFLIASSSVLALVSLYIGRSLSKGFNKAIEVADSIAKGDFQTQFQIKFSDEIGHLLLALQKTQKQLKHSAEKDQREMSLKNDISDLQSDLMGHPNVGSLASSILNNLASLSGATSGVLFVQQQDGFVDALANYACRLEQGKNDRFQLGEGLVGQCALEGKSISITNSDHQYLVYGDTAKGSNYAPQNIYLIPLIHNEQVLAVVELSSAVELSDYFWDLLERVKSNLSANIAILLDK